MMAVQKLETSMIDWKNHKNFFRADDAKCFVCGRKLEKEETKEIGVGPVCGGWTYSNKAINWPKLAQKMIQQGRYYDFCKKYDLSLEKITVEKIDLFNVFIRIEEKDETIKFPTKGVIHANGVLWVANHIEPWVIQEIQTISLEMDEHGKILMFSPYISELVTAVKKIPNARWNSYDKLWQFKPHIKMLDFINTITDICDQSTDRIQYEFEMDPEVTRIVSEYKEQLKEGSLVIPKDYRFEFRDNRVHAYSPFDRRFINLVKDFFIGARWTGQCWTFPLSPKIHQLLAEYEGQYELDPSMEKQLAHMDQATAITQLQTTDRILPGFEGLFPFQKVGLEYLIHQGRGLIGDEMGLGKAQPLTSKVLTPTGWKLMGDITVGDEIYDPNGDICRVTGVFDQGVKDIYKITFSDGFSARSCDEHLWVVNTTTRRFRENPPFVKSLSEIRNEPLRYKNDNYKWFIPVTSIIPFKEETLAIAPYLLGVLLGDGSIAHRANITTTDEEILERISPLIPNGLSLNQVKGDEITYRIASSHAGARNPLIKSLRDLGLHGKKSNAKFIPNLYLRSGVIQRVELLRGLLDTDGYVREDHISLTSASIKLAEDVSELVQSLGGIAKINGIRKKWTHKGITKEGLYYRVTIKFSKFFTQIYPIVTINRKLKALKHRSKYPPSRAITKIDFIGREPARCILVDSPTKQYLTDHYIVTHNTIQLLAFLEYKKPKKALIVVPAVVLYNWYKEASKWLQYTSNILVIKDNRMLNTHNLNGYNLVIINYAKIKKWQQRLIQYNPEIVGFDESHYMKNGKAQRTKAATAIATGRSVVMLSGTPTLNRPVELFPQLAILDSSKFHKQSFFDFANRYCDPQQIWNGKRYITTFTGASNLHDLHQELKLHMIRRKKENVIDLPDKLREIVYFELNNEDEYLTMKAQWRELKSHIQELRDQIKELYIDPEDDDPDTFHARQVKLYQQKMGEALAYIDKMKQCALKGKIDQLIEWIHFILDQGEKLIVFTTHIKTVTRIMSHFSDEAVSITGSTPNEKRVQIVEQFQQDPNTLLFVGNLKAANVGITLTAASKVAFIELGWTPADHTQAEDRAHRISQDSTVNVYYLLADNTIEVDIAELLMKKSGVVDAILDGTDENTLSVFQELMEDY